MSRSIGAKLRYSNSSDVELLTSIYQDLLSDRDEGIGFMTLFGLRHILSEILDLPYSWTNNLSYDDGDLSSESDSDDETWIEEWEPEELYKWILNELRGLQPVGSSVRLRDIRRRLEARLALSKSMQPSGTFHEAQNSSTDGGTNLVEPAPEDTVKPCPISFLPVELLQDIIHLARSERRGIRIPLTLSHVSSHFRSVTLGTPSVWSTIDNLLPTPIVKLYITRSGEEPLCLCIWVDRFVDLPSRSRDQWLNILSESLGRIKVTEVYGCYPRAFSLWTSWLNDSLTEWSSLARLELLLSESGQREYDTPKGPKWKSFPILQDLSVQGYPDGSWAGMWVPLPPSLRRLTFSKGGLGTVMKALEDLPDLHVLSLDRCSLGSLPSPQQADGITMTNLKELEVTRMSTDDIRALISHVHTPNLTFLSITYPVDQGPNIANFLISFTKAHPQLRSLQIRECAMAKNHWSSILQNVTHLNHLAIRGSDLRDEDLCGLGLALVPIIPNMTHLTLENEPGLTTSLVEQIVRTHPHLISVILRGWNASNVSQANVSAISRLVPYVQIETFGNMEDDDGAGSDREDEQWDDSYWEGSNFSEDDGWLSGDEAVAKGRR
ncbi:hypothetical protein FRC01_005593 [Tulasnella sp. 417]|nr:hypothetical protein FRC01_005593 [Tulasnella sp. 417]